MATKKMFSAENGEFIHIMCSVNERSSQLITYNPTIQYISLSKIIACMCLRIHLIQIPKTSHKLRVIY